MVELEYVGADEWPSWVAEGATLITVNRRLTRDLTYRYDRMQRQQGHSLWSTPDILPFSTWLESIWFQHVELLEDGDKDGVGMPVTLLTPFQSSLVWREMIKAHGGGIPSKSDDELTQLAVKAWVLVNEWQIPYEELCDEGNPNVEVFNRWMHAYVRRCSERAWIDAAVLPAHVLALLANSSRHKPTRYIFAGFDDFSPRQQCIIRALINRGDEVWMLAFPRLASQVEGRVYHDVDRELMAVADWAAGVVQEHPGATVGIVVPDLSAQRERVVRQLALTLHASARLNYGLSKLCFNVTLGQPLIEFPLIRAVFVALDLVKPVFHINESSLFLLNVYFSNGPSSDCTRALVDYKLRALDEVWLELGLLKKTLERFDPEPEILVLAGQLDALCEFQQQVSQRLYPSQWCVMLTALLRRLKWGEGGTLSSEQYQQYQAWHKIVDQLSQLDGVVGKKRWAELESILRAMTREMIFQPEADVVPIHVMGLFETAGLSFDFMWVMGMTDETLPAKPNPNPFVSIVLQKRVGFPHSSCERELLYAESLMARLSTSAKRIVMSYASFDGETEKRASPLIDRVVGNMVVETHEETYPGGETNAVYAGTAMEAWSDQSGPVEAIASKLKGGSELFKLQAACPFRAFVRLRLLARPLNVPEIGVNAIDRGVLIHGVLENFWRDVKTQQRLLALSDKALEKKVYALAVKEVTKMAKRKPMTFTSRFRAMECERLKKRVLSWLEIERARSSFDVVVVEGKQEIEISGLSLSTKIDRIDRLSDGSLFLIDYKTGQSKVAGWFGLRPDEPQLPLYAVSSDENIDAMAFAQLRVGDMCFKGLARHDTLPTGVEKFSESKFTEYQTSWSSQIDEWLAVLKTLARDFKSGMAVVDPKEGEKTCQYCDFANICRVSTLDSSHHGYYGDERRESE